MDTLNLSNPKHAIGETKAPLHLVPAVTKIYSSIAHFLGKVKYGSHNWRAAGVSASTYKSALERHMDRWWEGEEYDPVDGTPHLANALACINILIEGMYRGNLNDDRPPKTDLQPAHNMVEALMAEIKAKYADKNPIHYTEKEHGSTIQDHQVNDALARLEREPPKVLGRGCR